MKLRSVTAAILVATLLACSNAPDDILSTDHSIAARVGSRNLAIKELDTLVKQATQPSKMTLAGSTSLVEYWVDLQRLALAAAHSDTLSAYSDFAITPAVNTIKVDRFLKTLAARMPIDSATETSYMEAAHGIIALRHIFLSFPVNGGSDQRDSVRTFALSLRQRLSASNFAAAASRYSNDPASARRGGTLGLVPKHLINQGMFEIVRRLIPDSVSAPVETPVGIEIVQRMSWNDVRGEYPAALRSMAESENELAASDLALARSELTLAKYAPGLVRQALIDRSSYYEDETVLGTYDRDGSFTMRDFIAWLGVGDQHASAQLVADLGRVSDEQLRTIIENTVARSILLRSADSAGVTVSDSEKDSLRQQVKRQIVDHWRTVGMLPEQLSAGDPKAREVAAGDRVDTFLRQQLANAGSIVPIEPAVQRALDKLIKPRMSLTAVRKWLKLE